MSLEKELFFRSEKSIVFTNIFSSKIDQCGIIAESQGTKSNSSAELKILAEEHYQRGRQDGIAESSQAAAKNAKKNFDHELEGLKRYLEQVEGGLLALENNMLDDVLRLSIAIAQKITLTHMTLNATAVLPIIQKAIEMLPSLSDTYQIRLNPADAARIETYLDTNYKEGQISIIADDSIHVGGAIVSTKNNEVDATYEQRWNEIARALGADCHWVKNQ